MAKMRRQPWMPWSPSSPKKRRSSLMADYVKLDGVAASEGVAVGPAFVHVPHELKPERESISEDAVEDELKRFKNGVEARVRKLESPEAAVISVGEEFAGMFAAMEDEYLAARADDVRDVASQIAAELVGGKKSGLETLTTPS